MRNSVNNGQPPLRLQPGLESNSNIHPQAPMKGFEFLRYNIHEPAQPNNWSAWRRKDKTPIRRQSLTIWLLLTLLATLY